MKIKSVLTKSDGVAAIEAAFIIPVLFILVFGVIEYGRAIHANNVITNISREGANLAARTSSEFQIIMDSLALTSQPLDMPSKGMMYITEVLGQGEEPNTVPRVVTQSKWVGGDGGYQPYSKAWNNCGGWATDGKCQTEFGGLSDSQARANLNGLVIKEGERVYAVETFYEHEPIVTYVMKDKIELHSQVVF